MQPPTYAAGVRRQFEDLPAEVTDWVADRLGPVVSIRNLVGGFSPGVAAVVTAADGRAVFVKAVSAAANPGSLSLYRAERDVAARLPRLHGIVRPTATTELPVDGETYIVLVFPALDGDPPRHPWRTADLERVLDAQHALSQRLTPSPWPATEGDQRLPNFFRWWRRIVADPGDPWSRHPWVGRHVAALVAAEEQLRTELIGNTLSHVDLRADNLVLSDQHVWFVDWAHAQNAAPWVDAAVLLGDVIASHGDMADGGEIDVSVTIGSHPAFHGVAHDQVWRLLASLAGALHGMSAQPSPPGLPTIRSWQGATAESLLRWCQRTAPAGDFRL